VRYFRVAFDIPKDKAIKSARGVVTCDNFAVLYVNGKPACKTDDELNAGWRSPVQVDLKPLLTAGRNVLALRAENFDSETANPAGLIGVFQVEFEQGPPIIVATGPAWKSNTEEQAGWAEPALDDSAWKAVKILAEYGAGPWGDFLDASGRQRLTVSPIQADPFLGLAELPVDVDLTANRVYLEMDDLPDAAASVRVNGCFAGGCIGAPLRVNVTGQVKAGPNAIEIQPQAPKSARLLIVPRM
jgi:hypothetical protein